MKRRDFLHLAIAGTTAASARPLFAREQQAGPVEGRAAPLTTAAFTTTRAKFPQISPIADGPGAPPWVVQNLRIFRR